MGLEAVHISFILCGNFVQKGKREGGMCLHEEMGLTGNISLLLSA